MTERPTALGAAGGLPDLAQVRGQEGAERAVEIAAAGGHSLLLVGPAGSGKTLLARCLPGLLPPATEAEARQVAEIHAEAGLALPPGRPFRAPHFTLRPLGLLGSTRPGEASLAHGGVLLLDDLPAFRPLILRALRQPLEEGRAGASTLRPARFLLVGTLRFCPCGHEGDPRQECTCAPRELQSYRQPALSTLGDLVDLWCEVPALTLGELRGVEGEATAQVAARVGRAREIQLQRFGAEAPAPVNAALSVEDLQRYCQVDQAGQALLDAAFEKLGLSARALHGVLRVARTIADLAGQERIGPAHVAEAIQHRALAAWWAGPPTAREVVHAGGNAAGPPGDTHHA